MADGGKKVWCDLRQVLLQLNLKKTVFERDSQIHLAIRNLKKQTD